MRVRLIAIILLIVLGLTAVFLTYDRAARIENEYNGYLTAARENAEKGIPYIAFRRYQSALAIKCEDETVYQEYVQQAKLAGPDFYETALTRYPDHFPLSKDAYEMLCEYYYERENFSAVLSTANAAREANAASDRVRELYITCFYMYRYIAAEIDEAGQFLGKYAVVKRGEKYGFLDENGSYLLPPAYDQASPMMAGAAAVLENGEWHMINSNGYIVAKTSSPVDDLSFISNGLVRIGVNGKYSFTGSTLMVPETLSFDNASNFKNQRAAVQKDGKWAIVGSDKEMITQYVFDDVKLDDFDTCINNGVIFAKKDGKYYMIDNNGNQIGNQGFDDVYPFVSTEPAAVCVDGKWGFIDATGAMVIEPQYDSAKSFCVGLAPVCQNGTWSYINTSNIERITGAFSDCNPFSANGVASVKEGETWSYIQLYGYYYK